METENSIDSTRIHQPEYSELNYHRQSRGGLIAAGAEMGMDSGLPDFRGMIINETPIYGY